MNNPAPFLDVRSFEVEESQLDQGSLESKVSPISPFLSLYEVEESGGVINPEAVEYVTFLNELYDQELDEALFELANEAAALYDSQLPFERMDVPAIGSEVERNVEHHFEPLAREIENLLETLKREWTARDPSSLLEAEIDRFIDEYRHPGELNSAFEHFFENFGGWLKKAVKGATKLAKKGIGLAAKLGLGPILNKLKALIRPLLKQVLEKAIGKLPVQLQPVARKLAQRIPFLKEQEEEAVHESGNTWLPNITEVQHEFNLHVAELLFAPSEVEQEAEVAQVLMVRQAPSFYPFAELDHARTRFFDELSRLKDGEDPTAAVENFVPAILPALRVGIRIAGRKRIVNLLTQLLGKLIRRFVGPQYAPALSRAIVDAGLRLISLETTPDDEANAAHSAVAATLEETVRRVASLPDYVLDNQELLEGYVLEAFEQSAAANMPPVLSEETYRRRPELVESRAARGTWVMMPLRGSRKRYKKYSRTFRKKMTPYKAGAIQSFGGLSLAEFLEEQLGLDPGEEFEAEVHLYESIPDTMLPEIARLEHDTLGLGSSEAYTLLHPLTAEAATMLLDEPGLGREVEARYLVSPYITGEDQRFYHLSIPGKRPLMTPRPGGGRRMRRPTRISLILDFPASQIRVYAYLSEIRAQHLALKLRQRVHIGMAVTSLKGIIERGLRASLTGGRGRLKILHEAAAPGQGPEALRRLPAMIPPVLLNRVQQWLLTHLTGYFKQQIQQFVAATENAADGVTLVITIANPPGFIQLRQGLKGKLPSLAGLSMSDGTPDVTIRVVPGYAHE